MATAMNPYSVGQHHNALTQGTSDAASKIARYLGPLSEQIQPSPYDKVAYTNYDLPEFYKGKNLFLRDTIEGLIINDEDRWYTTLALPWAVTDQIHIQMNIWQFNGTLADRVPHEGISRLITSSKRQFKDHVVRRGLAFVLEADFYNTPEGDEQYRRNVIGISKAVQETQDHDTIFALLNCKRYQRMWQDQFGTMQMSSRKLMEKEILSFAGVAEVAPQGGEKTLEILYRHHARLMNRPPARVVPDLLILWPGAPIYLSMVSPKKTEYWAAGPEGVAQLRQGPKAMQTFGDGVRVVETRDFDIYDNEPPVQLLTRRINISERNPMIFEWRGDADLSDYQTKWRDILLYDENKDTMSKITFREAFMNSKLFESSGDYDYRLKNLVMRYKNQDRRPQTNDSDFSVLDDDSNFTHRYDKKGETFPAFFLTAPDSDGVYQLIEYFGQMDMSSATSKDFQQVAQTIFSKIPGDHSRDTEAWQDMIHLVHQIEQQTYDREYWRALIEKNAPHSVNDKDEFIGEHTPSTFGDTRPISIQEWKPNNHGSLHLPTGRVDHIKFPAGYANGPGLLTLADEASSVNSPWKEIGNRARSAVDLVQRLIYALQKYLRKCELINPDNRAPWFHKADPLSTFFQLISVNRDPIFIAHIRAVMKDKVVRGKTYGQEEPMEEDEIPWNLVPLFTISRVGNDSEALKRALQDLFDGKVPRGQLEGKGEQFTYTSIVTGGAVVLDVKFLHNATLLTKELRAMMLMGRTSFESLLAITNTLDKLPRDRAVESKRMLIDFILGYAAGNTKIMDLRKIVMALNLESTDVDKLAKTIDAISLPKGIRDKKKIQEYKDHIKRLLEGVRLDNDPDVIDKKGKGSKFLPKGIKEFDGKPIESSKETASFSELREQLETIFELVAHTNALVRVSGANTVPFDLGKPDDWAAVAIPTSANAQLKEEINKKRNEVMHLVNMVNAHIVDLVPAAAQGSFRKEAEKRFSEKGGKFHVQDDEEAAYGVQFYRSPLTMSYELLESLSNAGAAAFIRPSDPSTGHTSEFVLEQKGVLPDYVWRRPQYAHIRALNDDPDVKKLEHMTFISKHIEIAQSGRKDEHNADDDEMDIAFGSRSLHTKKRATRSGAERLKRRKGNFFDEVSSSEYSDSEDEMGRVLDYDQSKGPSIGAHMGGYREPKDKWTKKDLRKGDSAYDVRRPFDSESMEHSDMFRGLCTPTFKYRFSKSNAISDSFIRVIAQCFLATRSTGHQWLHMIDSDVHVPINIILWRLFIDHDMASAILMKGGLETGANMYGHSNFEIGNDVISKVIYGNFTFYSKAMVWKEANVHLIENIKPEGYAGGSNAKFFRDPKEIDLDTENRPSIIATAIPINEDDLPWVMSFTGSLDIHDLNEEIEGKPRISYSSAEYYDELWNVGEMLPTSDPGSDTYGSRTDRLTVRAFQGQQLNFNRATRMYDKVIDCVGHRGRGCYPGAARVWNGHDITFRDYDWDKHKFE